MTLLPSRSNPSVNPNEKSRQLAYTFYEIISRKVSMRHLITLGFAVLAVTAYGFGIEYGAGALFLAGGIFEIIAAKRMRRKTQVPSGGA